MMGAMGYGPFENDQGLDVQGEFEERVKGGEEPQKAIEALVQGWGESVSYGCNRELIALLEISLQRGIALDDHRKALFAAALNRELEEETLNEWEDPHAREKVLLKTLKRIGAKRERHKAQVKFKHPQIHFDSTAQARKVLIRLAEYAKRTMWFDVVRSGFGRKLIITNLTREEQEWIQQNFPPFMRDLWNLLEKGIEEEEAKVHDQASLERKMMIGTFLGFFLCYDRSEIEAMLNRCLRPLGR
jgi:hypothetical protein